MYQLAEIMRQMREVEKARDAAEEAFAELTDQLDQLRILLDDAVQQETTQDNDLF